MSAVDIGLPEALERAASALPRAADGIRPANGDPHQLAALLDAELALEVLTWLLRNEPGAGAELVEAWAEGDDDALAVLQRVEAEGLPKLARKALRRAFHRLRSRGVEFPEAPRTSVVSTLPSLDEAVDEARLTPLDPRGMRVAYLAMDHPSSGVRLFELVLDDERGIVEFDVYSAGRGRVRRFLREVESRDTWPAIAAPADSVRALIGRIAARQAGDRPAPRGFSEWRSRLGDASGDVETPGELVRGALGGDSEGASLDPVLDWVGAGTLGPWPPPLESLRPVADKLDEVARGVILVSGARKRDQVDDVLREALGEVYPAEVSERVAVRFEEAAFVAWQSDNEDDALACLAGARAFRERAPADNPIARAMLEKVLGPAIERAVEEKSAATEESSLLVEP